MQVYNKPARVRVVYFNMRYNRFFSLLTLSLALTLLAACSKREEVPDFFQQIHSANKLTFASMTVTKTAGLNSDWHKLPGTKRIAIYSYDTYLEAYINLEELRPEDVEIDEENRTVTVTLPPIRTELVGRDMEMRKEYDNVGLLRIAPDSKERAQVKEIANREVVREVEENRAFRRRLITAARSKARIYFETLLARDGYTPIIDFRSSGSDAD
ncbi:MAG: DUF4230 domain-containing protein [Bacteroides sp.]|nr:DUF4230 domain-containing protein [Bacteroides sp.]